MYTAADRLADHPRYSNIEQLSDHFHELLNDKFCYPCEIAEWKLSMRSGLTELALIVSEFEHRQMKTVWHLI